MTIPILCGGAAINTNYINRIAKEDGIYEPGVFYCNTMFEGLKTMDVLVSDEKPKLLADWKEKLENWKEKSTAIVDPDTLPKSDIKPVNLLLLKSNWRANSIKIRSNQYGRSLDYD